MNLKSMECKSCGGTATGAVVFVNPVERENVGVALCLDCLQNLKDCCRSLKRSCAADRDYHTVPDSVQKHVFAVTAWLV